MLTKTSGNRNILSVITAGLLYGLSFPPVNLFFFVYFSFGILLSLIFTSLNIRQLLSRTYFVFFTACMTAVSWIALSGIREGADPFLILGGIVIMLIYPLFFVVPSVIFYFIKKNLSEYSIIFSLIFFPFVWTAFEYTSSLGQISFPWLLSGNTQTYNLAKIQFAEYTGVFGVSFWICTVSVCLFYIYSNYKKDGLKNSRVKLTVCFILMLLIYFLPDIYNRYSGSELKFTGYTKEGRVKIGILQPDINPWRKWGGRQSELIDSYAGDIRKIHSANQDVDIVILPETAFPYYFRESFFDDKYEIIKNVCDSLNLPLLIGTPDLQIYDNQSSAPPDAKVMKKSGLKYDTYNSAFLFEPGKDKSGYQKHYKVKLVAGSERFPYQEYLPFTKSLIEWGVGLGSWQIGKDTAVFILKGKEKVYRFNTAICYESVYPGFFSEFVKKGTDFSVIITNDGWWGKLFGTYQHNQFAVFRSIENRTWIARCANTGISCFIDPYGNMYDKTEIDTDTYLVREIGVRGENTFYTLNGDLFASICLLTGLISFLISFFLKNKNKLISQT